MRRRHALTTTLASIGLIAAACTAGGSTNPSPPVTINPSASHAPVTLTVWTTFSKSTHELSEFQSVLSTFEQKYPWITVKTVPDKADTDVLKAITAGRAQGPDVAHIFVPDDAPEFCSKNAYVDLTPYAKQDNVNLPSLVPAGALAYTSYKGNQCMLPMLTDAYGLYYNTAMFQKAGIANPPKTYSELFDDVKKLTQFNPDGSIKVAGFLPLAVGDYELANFVNGVYSDAHWYGSDGKSTLASDPRFAQLLQFTKSMTDWLGYDKLNRFFAKYDGGKDNSEFSPSNLFEAGKLAMDFDGEWRVGFITNDKSKVQYATAPFPVADDRPDLYGVGQIGGSTIGIPRGSAHPAEAWLLVKYLALDTQAEQRLGEALKNIPTVIPALQDPTLTGDPNFATFLKIFANPHSRYKEITTLGLTDATLYGAFVDKYLAGKEPDLQGGLQKLATQIDKQLQLGG
jgi:multiple sugar transport system substrate-binding protein